MEKAKTKKLNPCLMLREKNQKLNKTITFGRQHQKPNKEIKLFCKYSTVVRSWVNT